MSNSENKWYKYYDIILEKLYALEMLERSSPYKPLQALGVNLSFWDRIRRAINVINNEFSSNDVQLYLLLIFSKIIYLTDNILMHSWRHLYNKLIQLLYNRDIIDGSSKANIDSLMISKVLFMEEDDGLFLNFIENNNIQGRLDRTMRETNYCRVGLDLIDRTSTEYEVWVLLVDFTLSGTSLISSLKRLIKLKEIINKNNDNIIIVVLTQVITESAFNKLKENFSDRLNKDIIIYYSLFIPVELTLKDCSKSILFKEFDNSLCKEVVDFL